MNRLDMSWKGLLLVHRGVPWYWYPTYLLLWYHNMYIGINNNNGNYVSRPSTCTTSMRTHVSNNDIRKDFGTYPPYLLSPIAAPPLWTTRNRFHKLLDQPFHTRIRSCYDDVVYYDVVSSA